MRVVPDVSGITKHFDYVVPAAWEDDGRAELVDIGSEVRIDLHGRRVGGWIVDVDVEPPAEVKLAELARVSGYGPPAEVIELARWAAQRWAGRLPTLLKQASPPRRVTSRVAPPTGLPLPEPLESGVERAFAKQRNVVVLPPATDRFPLVLEAARRGDALIVAPSVGEAKQLAGRLRRAGATVALYPDDWARAAAGGCSVIGARSAVWAPMPQLTTALLLDEHDEVHQDERMPTWHARDVLIERADRAGATAVLVSPSPTLHALDWGAVLRPSRGSERRGWPHVDIIDRRDEDPVRAGLLSPRLTPLLRADGRVVCVLNRKGRSRRLACASCGELAIHELCSVPLVQNESGRFACPTCDTSRPQVCSVCGSTTFKNLRAGIQRVREEVEALSQRPTAEISADAANLPTAEVYVGTEAVLHRLADATTVIFLDFDQELLAKRYRAGVQAMGLLIRAARLVGGRDGGGRLAVQTRLADHEVLQAALHADPSRLVERERIRREELRLPPVVAMAEISGEAADAFVAGLDREAVEVLGPRDGRWLVKAAEPRVLGAELSNAVRPAGRLRIVVDPPRV